MFKKILSFGLWRVISKAATHKLLILCAAVVLSCIGGMAYAAQLPSNQAAIDKNPKPVVAKPANVSSAPKELAHQKDPQIATPDTSATAPKASPKPTTPVSTTGTYGVSLSTYAITVEAGKQSQHVTANTSDGRKVAWMIAAPRGAQLYNNSTFGAPASAYTFKLASGINALPGTYDMEVRAYIPSRSPKFVTTILKVTVVKPRTFQIELPSWVLTRTTDSQAIVTYTFQRNNGHAAPIAVRATISSCIPGVSVGQITPIGTSGGYVYLNIAAPVVAGTCRVHVIGDDGSYTAAKYIDVQFMDY